MATNENEIGVRARFIMEDFDRHVQQYNAKLAQANQTTETFYKEQTATQKKAVTASKLPPNNKPNAEIRLCQDSEALRLSWPESLLESSWATKKSRTQPSD